MFISPFSQTYDSNTWQISVTLKKRSGSQEPSRGLYKCDPLKKHGLSSKLQLSICIE